MFNKLTEGIHLVAYVTDRNSGERVTIEDDDYNSKKDFEKELKLNGYTNISILDNRDLYLIDNTDYSKMSELKKKLKDLKEFMATEDKESVLYKMMNNDYNKLKEIYDKAMKISLTEEYVLKGEQDGRVFNIAFNNNKEKLQRFKDELQPAHEEVNMFIVEESCNKNKNESKEYKIVDTNKLPSIEYELESRVDNEDYNKIYKKLLKSKTGRIRCDYNELDLISAIYLDNDNYDYDKLKIQNILYEKKLQEVSRNELLVKTKGETISRYNRAAGYKGFSVVNIDTTNLLNDNTLTIILKVGKYNDVVQLEDVLYWIQITAEQNTERQINLTNVRQALANSIDGMDIKIDCECRRLVL